MGNERTANDILLDKLLPSEQPPAPKRQEQPATSKVKNVDPAVLQGDVARDAIQQMRTDHRFSASARVIEIPEQVIGSAHDFQIPIPLNLDASGRGVFMQMKVEGEGMRLGVDTFQQPSLFGSMAGTPSIPSVPLAFRPSRPGKFPATVQVSGTWEDGHVEECTIAVVATARFLDQTPSPTINTGSEKQSESPSPGTHSIHDAETDPDIAEDMTVLGVDFFTMVSGVSEFQGLGVTAIESEAKGYVPPPPPESVWGVLVELAITMGTAGVAASAGNVIGHALGEAIAKATKKTANHILEEGLATSMEDGIKESFGKALKPAHEAEKEEAHAPSSKEPKAKPGSSNKRIAFFERQSEKLLVAKAAQIGAAARTKDRLEKKLGAESIGARLGILGLTRGLKALQPIAMDKQKEATAAKWVSYKAQAAHGTEQAFDGNGVATTVTKMDDIRNDVDRVYGTPRRTYLGKKAVLQIGVSGADVETIQPYSSRLNGVSRDTADRFLDMDLASAMIPLRIMWRDATITLDEAGRVQMSDFYDERNALHAAERVALAERIVTKILSRSLLDWGIKEVENDDVSVAE